MAVRDMCMVLLGRYGCVIIPILLISNGSKHGRERLNLETAGIATRNTRPTVVTLGDREVLACERATNHVLHSKIS